MNSFYDVQQLLKKFGTYVYTKDIKSDCDLMEFELDELHQSGLLATDEFLKAKVLVRKRRSEQL